MSEGRSLRLLLVPPARELPVRGQAGHVGVTLGGPSQHPYAVFVRALLSGRYGGTFVELWPLYPTPRRSDPMLDYYTGLVHVIGEAPLEQA